MSDIKPEHPRAESLRTREKLAEGLEDGIVTPEGMAAHGRGEAFDYILGEKTTKRAEQAIEAAAAEILRADEPVFSVNGNVAALVPEDIARLANKIEMNVEVNLFHKSKRREEKIAEHLRKNGIDEILGIEEGYSSEIEEIQSHRRVVDERGIKSADTVVVPLEDGDRTEALKDIGKNIVTVDLNPMSRTAKVADVTIVDNIMRAMPLLIERIEELQSFPQEKVIEIAEDFDNEENLAGMLKLMLNRLERLS